jgi:hypothetical protein
VLKQGENKMKSARTLGFLVIGVWLLLWGLANVLPVEIPGSKMVLGALAIVGGFLTLLGL